MPSEYPMPKTIFTPEVLSPYDPRHVPLEPPVAGAFDKPTVAICVNASWVSHIDGMIGRLLYRDAWLGSDEEIDNAIEQVRKILAEMRPGNMSCCCDRDGVLSRINSDGIYEESADGGETWSPAPEHDPRRNITLLPPLTGGAGDERKCKAANSIIAFLKDKQSADVTRCENNATLGEFAEALIALLVAIGVITTGGAFAIFGAAIWALVAGITCNQFQAAFTEAFWQHFTCALYCNMQEDGSVVGSSIAKILSQLATDHAPGSIEYEWANKHLLAMGTGGLTNAARLGLSAGYECDECDCPSPCLSEAWVLAGQIVGSGVDYVDVQSELTERNGLLANWVAYGSDDAAYCCHLCGWSAISGAIHSATVFGCAGNPVGSSDVDMRRFDGYSLAGQVTVRLEITPNPGGPCA